MKSQKKSLKEILSVEKIVIGIYNNPYKIHTIINRKVNNCIRKTNKVKFKTKNMKGQNIIHEITYLLGVFQIERIIFSKT